MSSDLTHEQVVGARKVRSSSQLAALNAAAKPEPRHRLHLDTVREVLATAENEGWLDASGAMRLSALLFELEVKHPGELLVPLDQAEFAELYAFHSKHLAHQRAQRAERERATWPKCAPGPCAVGPNGLEFPERVPTREEAEAILAQVKSTAGLRELTSREKQALRVLRRQSIRQPSAPAEFSAIAQAKLRRLSKAAKRARNAQRMMEGNRAALQRLAGEVAC